MNKIRIFKELGFIYIAGGKKLLTKKDAEDYANMKEVAENHAKQESEAEKIREEKKL